MFSPTQGYLEGLDLQRSYTLFSIILVIAGVLYTMREKSPINMIPAVGETGIFTSYISAFKWFKHASAMLKEGYHKHGSRVFRVSNLFQWHVIVTDPKLIEELRQAPDDTLSFEDAVRETLATEYTLGPNIVDNQYHTEIIRSQLTRNLGNVFPAVRDEIVRAFDDEIPETDDWTQVSAFEKILHIISRASNRAFVGAPTCRDPEYMDLTIQFTMDVVMGGQIINLFPTFLKPLAGRILTRVPKAIRKTAKHIGPIIEERMQMIAEYGSNYPDKPNDFLSWLIDEAVGEERTTDNLARRILTVNFAAIHTSSMSFTHALYSLAANLHYIEPLREEIEAVVAEHGWSKVSLTRMRKLDSLFKESLRVSGLGELSMTRIALKPFRFSDGTLLPKGTKVSVYMARHKNEEVYHNAGEFRGFRFSDLREEEGEGAKNQCVATSTDYLTFGHGRHACPGRFFAATELKAMMAHVLLTYDFKLENEGVRPKDDMFATARIPNRTAKMLFRRRQK